MPTYIVKRILQLLPVIFVVICVNFFVLRLAPGDPTNYLIGDASVTPEFVEELRRQYGFDQPLYVQLWSYLVQVAHGDLGYSFVSRAPVSSIILSRMPASLLLLGTQFILSIIFGIALGVISAYRRGSATDYAVSFFSLVGFAVPAFWLGQMLILVFALGLDLFPAQGMRSLRFDLTGFAAALDMLHHLALPTLTLTVFNLALIARVTRANMINVLHNEYITFARSKGLPESTVIMVHALKNAIPPVITVIGLNLRTLIAGAVLTETVFAWPGVGRLTFEAILARDYPVLMGILIVIGITVVIANILTDIAYSWLDPRVRYQ